MTFDAANESSITDKKSNGQEPKTHAEGNSYDSWRSPLDPSMYDVDYEFFSGQTGITDPEELKAHILKVQAEAFAVSPEWRFSW